MTQQVATEDGKIAAAADVYSTPAATRAHRFVRPARLASGIIMLVYLSTHLVNHALGNISLAAAETGLSLAKRVWLSWPGTIALYGAAAMHVGLALFTLFERRHWRLPAIEWLRLYAGFSLPLLLIGHAVNTRLGASVYEYDPQYRNVIATIVATGNTGWQIALLAPGWLHGCLGVWISLRRKTWALRAKPVLVALVVALPLLSATGFWQMRNELENDESGGGAAYYAPAGPKGEALLAGLRSWRDDLTRAYLAMIVGAIAAGFVWRRISPSSR